MPFGAGPMMDDPMGLGGGFGGGMAPPGGFQAGPMGGGGPGFMFPWDIPAGPPPMLGGGFGGFPDVGLGPGFNAGPPMPDPMGMGGGFGNVPGWGGGGWGGAQQPFGGPLGNRGPFGVGARNFYIPGGGMGGMPSMSFGMGAPRGGGGSMGGMMGGMGGGMMGGGMGGMMGGGMGAGFAAAQAAANAANEQRYQAIFGGYQRVHDLTMGDVNNISDQAKTDLNRNYDNLRSSGFQSLVDRGLGNTTITDTMAQGVERERQAGLNRLNDQTLREKLDARLNTAFPMLNFMERRDDVGPDPSILANLGMAAGRAGFTGGAAPTMGAPTTRMQWIQQGAVGPPPGSPGGSLQPGSTPQSYRAVPSRMQWIQQGAVGLPPGYR